MNEERQYMGESQQEARRADSIPGSTIVPGPERSHLQKEETGLKEGTRPCCSHLRSWPPSGVISRY